MRLEGNTSTVCQIEGKWRYPLPKCLAPCVVPQISQGRVHIIAQNDSTTSSVVQHGDALTVECDAHYEFLASFSPVTCNNGTWTQIPKCEPARCKHLPRPPKNGMVIAPKMEHNMRAKFKCKDGFSLKGEEFVQCSYGNWTGELPHCQEVYCPYPGLVPHGKILLVGNMGLYDYRPYVRKVMNNKQIMYDCDKGYILLNDGPPGATCIGGSWSPKQLPACVLAQHPRLRWSRRRRSAIMEKYKQAYMRHHKLISEKREKFAMPNYLEDLMELTQREMEEMKKDSRLSQETKARVVRSTFLSRLKRALKSTSSSRTIGLSHKGSGGSLSLRRGNKKGNYDEEDEYDENLRKKYHANKHKGPCEALSIEPYVNIEIVKEGKETNVSYSSGTVVKMACGKGYGLNLVGNNTAKCVRGKWKPEKPMCSLLPCHVPELDYGLFKLAGQPVDDFEYLNETTDVENGQVVEFSCEPGYNVQGPSNLRCWHGEWTVTALPDCTAAPCQLPEITNGQYLSGYRAGLTIANGSSVTFQCDSEYSKSSIQPVQCMLGSLYPRQPACSQNATWTGDQLYLGGADIIRGGDIGALEFANAKQCGPPAKVHGSLIYRNGEPLIADDRNFPHGTEVSFNCIESIMGEKTTWRIVCEDGSWIGRSLNCDEIINNSFLSNSTCVFKNQEPNVLSFYNDQLIREDTVEFPAGALLVSRCVDIGKYAMVGPDRRRCMGGEWDGPKPACFGLNQENDYSMEKPPTILFRHQLGPIAQSNDGRLIVYPGTILHMECLWIRRFGMPKWNVSHDYRKYPEGWTEETGRDSGLEYRLSIYHASKDDSGTFTCVTPARHTHAVEIIVKAVHCPVVPQRRGLSANTQSTKMNTKLTFSCINGNALIGAQEVVCLPSGNWSAPFPVCESIECGDVGISGSRHLRVTVVSREVGGRALFSCSAGFGLRGPHETACLSSGEWAAPLPSCVEVQCETPAAPDHGYVQGTGPFKAGDVVQFNCNPDYMMEGQPIVACQDNGRWSGPVPKCKPACSYPGTTISGRMSSVKFYYKIGENITFTCDEGHTLRGAGMLKCHRNGKWSNAIPTCVPDANQR